jgi:hypothetical protein
LSIRAGSAAKIPFASDRAPPDGARCPPIRPGSLDLSAAPATVRDTTKARDPSSRA